MVVVCINSYVVHVCSLSSLIWAQSQFKVKFRMFPRLIPFPPSGDEGGGGGGIKT